MNQCLTSQSVSSEEDALHQLFVADMNRAMGSHDLNLDSTRSHCIYTLHLVLTTATGTYRICTRAPLSWEGRTDKHRFIEKEGHSFLILCSLCVLGGLSLSCRPKFLKCIARGH